MQCVQYASYSVLDLTTKIYRVRVKGHQNDPQTPRILPRPLVLKFLDPPLVSLIGNKPNGNVMNYVSMALRTFITVDK